MTRRYPIDGLWLTENELARYFLGQLEIESHHRLRQIDRPEYQPLPETIYEQPKKATKQTPPMRVAETRGIET
jgi:hypothetical protein